MEDIQTIQHLLKRIYGEVQGIVAYNMIAPIMERFSAQKRDKTGYFSEEDVVLITYGDSLNRKGVVPLAVLHEFANETIVVNHQDLHHVPYSFLRRFLILISSTWHRKAHNHFTAVTLKV